MLISLHHVHQVAYQEQVVIVMAHTFLHLAQSIVALKSS